MRYSQIAIASLAMAIAFGGCSLAGRPPRAVVVLDEAFAASRPSLAAHLQAAQTFGDGPAKLFSRALVVPLNLSEGAGKAIEAAREEKRRSGKSVILVTSPLVASAIIGGGSWSGEPPLLVPEYRGALQGKAISGLYTAVTDSVPAYQTAGRAAGLYIAELAKAGSSPCCAVLFSESPSRPRTALAAFTAAFTTASGGRVPTVRELPGGNRTALGNTNAMPTTPESDAEAAVAELLGFDLRLLFIAIGPGSEAAISKASRPGLVVGLDSAAPMAPRGIAFRIRPDDKALAFALEAERRTIGMTGDTARSVPALLVAEAGADSLSAGKLPFSQFLSNAALGAKGSDLSH
jgi:hypothetical protein